VLLAPAPDVATIAYRQRVLADVLRHPEFVRDLCATAHRALAAERAVWGLHNSPESILYRSSKVLNEFLPLLRHVRDAVDSYADRFASDGLTRLCATFVTELDERFFADAEAHCRRLRFQEGVLLSARLGGGNEGVDHQLRRPSRKGWRLQDLVRFGPRDSYTFDVHPRDEAGLRALAELRERAIINVAAALSESVDHMHAFFEQLMFEAGFYVACANLREHLAALGAPVCVPQVVGPDGTMLVARELCDVGLMLTLGERTVANDVDADGRPLVLITGANSGGKSTFLRSVGLALLMMSSGMFVAASSLRESAHRGLFTHFIRREDATMTRGRLDDELLRMRDIAEELHAGSVVLFNESFAATNEREGSEIARQIVGALLDAGVRVFYVTHMYDLAESLCRGRPDQALSLRAERGPDGRRTFKVVPSPPLETSYGEDLYVRVGGWRGTPPA
jgi:hypothetical protein